MNCGILTFPFSDNYGAVLQAYALMSYISSLGHRVSIIPYDTSGRFHRSRSALSVMKTAVWKPVRGILAGNGKHAAFVAFRKNKLVLSTPITDKDELDHYLREQRFDCLISGSDQVWNPDIHCFDTSYLLDFDGDWRKISYAASFGRSSVPQNWAHSAVSLLEQFDAVSVREQSALELLQQYGLHHSCQVVCDPVLLLGAEQWKAASADCPVHEPFILCYVMPGDHLLESMIELAAKQLRKKTGFKIVYLGRKEYKRLLPDGTDLIHASPEEFVSLFSHAEAVVTNSFHGTAFSVIFQKPLYAFVNPSLDGVRQLGSRISDLLHLCVMDDRLITTDVLPDLSAPSELSIDKTTELILRSKAFLSNSLNFASEASK